MDNAHSGIFSDLAVLYSKYSPEKLMEHIKVRGRSIKDEGRKLTAACISLMLRLNALFNTLHCT